MDTVFMSTFLLMIVHLSSFSHGITPLINRQKVSTQIDVFGQDGSGSEGTVNKIYNIRFSLKRFNFTVPANAEPGYTIGRLTIVQDDVSRDYSEVTFKLVAKNDSESKDYFNLEPKTGVIRVNKSGVDIMDTHVFIVTAMDGNSPASPLALAVLTIDTVMAGNFYPPIFGKMRYRASVAFDADRGTTILTVRATDEDDGENDNMVTYRLLNPMHRNNIFRCKKNGEITNKKVFGVDRIGYYTLIVEGIDGGNPSKSSTTKVKITVYDVRPLWSKNYTFTIPENTTAGSKIGVVEATSWQPSDERANISYSIVTRGSYFRIDQSSGEISSVLGSDFGRSYRLLVRAQETGFALRTKDTVVTVSVIYDMPTLQTPSNSFFNISIPEDIPIGSQIHKFDYNTEVSSYRILNSSVDVLPFMIDEESGEVCTIYALDRERNSMYAFKIQVEIESSYRTIDMRIAIEDVNDNKPRFENCQAKIQLHDTTLGTEVIRHVVTDADALSVLSYHITSGNIGNVIRAIKCKNGVSIVIVKQIERQQYDIKLTASDGTYESVCNISIEVVNRNTPLFENWYYNALIHEEQPIGKRVLQVRATDNDVGVNGHVTYSMNFNPYFTINQSTGEIFTVVNLDREYIDHHVFNVTATDGGNPPRQSWTTVNVLVLDINDSHPRFLNLPYFGKIQENNNNSISIITVEAIDDDNHTFAGITYGLQDDRFSTNFVIDNKTGEVKSRQGCILDRELTPEFNLIVTASDGTFQTKTTIFITVIDVDDNPPSIVSPTQYEVQENRGIGASIGRVLLSDPDEEISMPVRFGLDRPDSKFFSIDNITGVIRTKRNIRYRNKNVYNRLEVVATCGRYTIREPLVVYVIRNETLEPTTISAEASTFRNQTMTSRTTVSYTINASIPLKDEGHSDVTTKPVTYRPPAVSPGKLEYVNTRPNTTTQEIIGMQTTPVAYQINISPPTPVTEPLARNITSTPAAVLSSKKTSQQDGSPNCSCGIYSDEERKLTMKILQAKLETQETELKVRQKERRVINMKLRYWTHQFKRAEEHEINCGTQFFRIQDVIGTI